MRLTQKEYEILKARTKKSSAVIKRDTSVKQVAKAEVKKEDTSRSIVRITSYRTRLLDPDNAFGKWHVDGLRYGGCIIDDSTQDIELYFTQVKVSTKKEERTEIEIIKDAE